MEISKDLVKAAELNMKPELCPQLFSFLLPKKMDLIYFYYYYFVGFISFYASRQ